MNWSPQQADALDSVAAWMKDGSSKLFVLQGYAGTGKTTLARHFAEGLSHVRFVTYTGKAALVLQSRGCQNAQTIHSLFYSPAGRGPEWEQYKNLKESLTGADQAERDRIEKQMRSMKRKLGQPRFSFDNETEARHADLVVIDEGSMVDKRMAEEIMSVAKKVLFLGDPAQLPPIRNEGFFMSVPPDVVLTEIHRQAAENPILFMATLARNGKPIPYGDHGKAKHLSKREVDFDKEIVKYDQVIAGYNKTRRSLNTRMRKLLKMEGEYPVDGDRLICLRNNRELGLLNGLQGVAKSDSKEIGELIVLSVEMETGDAHENLNVWIDAFDAYRREVHLRDFYDRIKAEEFDWSYCVTAHKGQGSQWPKVMVCDDQFGVRQPETRKRWMYTSITRAQDELLILS